MDIALVLSRIRPGQDWGPCAQTDSAYADLAAKWRGSSAVPTSAEMDAEWSAIQAQGGVAGLERTKQRADASAAVVADSLDGRLRRSVLAALIDEVNAPRQWIAAFKAQVLLSSSLADLKARVAALPDTPDRTLAQAKSAVQAKAGSAATD